MKRKACDVITDVIRAKIESGEWPAGMRLPAEPELASQLEVGRSTLREAVQNLVYGGYLNRVHGVGTFVCEKTIAYGMNDLVSISRLLEENGYASGIQNVELDIAAPSQKAAELLSISKLDPVYKVQRVFTADGKPVVLEFASYPCRLLNDVKAEDFQESSFHMLDSRGIEVRYSNGWVKPVAADERIAKLLNIDQNSPLLLMESVVCDQNGGAITYVKDYFTEWFNFPIHRVRSSRN